MAGADAFVGTLFEAALDAAQGKPWQRVSPGGSDRWWGTQGERVQVATRLCGVAVGININLREALAAALQVGTLTLLGGASAIQARPGYQSRGLAARSVLEKLPEGACAIERLSVAGYLIGFWGQPYAWDPRINRLRQLDFGRFFPGLRERAQARPPPSTKAGRIRARALDVGSPPSKERTLPP